MADERVEFYKNKIENVLADRSKINDIVDVITGVENKNESISLVCIEGIGRILSELIQSNYCPVKTKKTKFAKPAEKPEEIVEVWLTSNYDLTVKKLLVLLKSPIVKISLEALKALMKFVKAESTKNPQKFWFSNDLFLKILINLIDGSYDNSMTVKNFISYLHFNDVSYYTLRNINKVITQTEKDPMMNNHVITGGNFPRNIYELLSVVTIPEEETDLSNLYVVSMENVSEKHSVFRHSVMNLSAYKKVFTEAWMAFLGLSLDSSLYRHILLDLEHKVIPYFVDPKILMDFLVDSYNAGGVTSILALNGLFVLIHKHNLDYPDFYKKLYSLFDVEVFHMKYRARFFYLADLFLMSSHLPAYLVAAFIKRLSRLALRAPPYAIAMVIVFIGNLIRRHPNCKVLIHQKEKQAFDEQNKDERCINLDPFQEDEVDPSKCNALKSSLWELETLRHHYYPGIKSLVEFLEKPIGKTEADVSKWFDSSYESLLNKEFSGINKNNVFLEYQPPKGLMQKGFDDLWCVGN